MKWIRAKWPPIYSHKEYVVSKKMVMNSKIWLLSNLKNFMAKRKKNKLKRKKKKCKKKSHNQKKKNLRKIRKLPNDWLNIKSWSSKISLLIDIHRIINLYIVTTVTLRKITSSGDDFAGSQLSKLNPFFLLNFNFMQLLFDCSQQWRVCEKTIFIYFVFIVLQCVKITKAISVWISHLQIRKYSTLQLRMSKLFRFCILNWKTFKHWWVFFFLIWYLINCKSIDFWRCGRISRHDHLILKMLKFKFIGRCLFSWTWICLI